MYIQFSEADLRLRETSKPLYVCSPLSSISYLSLLFPPSGLIVSINAR
jgi:hypothetical protein